MVRTPHVWPIRSCECFPCDRAWLHPLAGRQQNSNSAYCVSAVFESATECTTTIRCEQTCESALGEAGACSNGDDDTLWALVSGAVFGGIMLFYILTKACCAESFGTAKLPTQSSTTFTHATWIVWWLAMIVVTQVAQKQSGCMTVLAGISIGVGVLVFVVSGFALCCTRCLQPWGRKTPLRVPCAYDHAFRCSTMITSLSLMAVIFVLTSEFVGKSMLLALVFAGVLTCHLKLVVAPEWGTLNRLKEEGAQNVLKGIADPERFMRGFSNFVNFHATLAFCIVLDVLVRILVDYINMTAHEKLLDNAEKDPSIECPSAGAIVIVPMSFGMILCPILLANTMSFTNEIREFVEGRIAVSLQMSGAQQVDACPPGSSTLALFLRPTLAGIETYMPLHMFTGVGAGFLGFGMVVDGIIKLVDALTPADDDDDGDVPSATVTTGDDNPYETWNNIQIYGMQILYGLVFLWYFHIIQLLARATFPTAEDLTKHQEKMREIVADATESSKATAESDGLALQIWTKLRTTTQYWVWQQAAALVVHAITLGSGVHAADMLKADPLSGFAAVFANMLAVFSAVGILFAIFCIASISLCSKDHCGSGACCGCWRTVAHDESRRIATMNRAIVFMLATLTALILGFLCTCSIDEDIGPRVECSDDVKSARSFSLFAWCLNLFLIMETVINDNFHLVFDPEHVDLPYPRSFVVLVVTSNAYCILVNVIMVSSGHNFHSDTNTCAVAGSHLIGMVLSACMVYVSMFLNNEMNLYLRYAALKSRSSIAVEYFDSQHVLSAYTSSGGVFATLPWYSFAAFVVALLVTIIRKLLSSVGSIPAVYEGMLWVFVALAVLIQASVTPGFLHPIVTPELIEKLGKPAAASRPASRRHQPQRQAAASANVVPNPAFQSTPNNNDTFGFPVDNTLA